MWTKYCQDKQELEITGQNNNKKKKQQVFFPAKDNEQQAFKILDKY